MHIPKYHSLVLAALVAAVTNGAVAQDNVTIPKSRLEELEKKERELERLQKDAGSQQETAPVQSGPLGERTQHATNTLMAPTSVPPAPIRVSPPLSSLPSLKSGEVVEAVDLANYYQAGAAAADQRFKGQRLTIRGEIASFDKPLLKRDYRILLRTGERDAAVICEFYPPAAYNAVFSAERGSQLVALIGEQRLPLARVGETVLIQGTCKGWRGSAVTISAGELMQPKPGIQVAKPAQ